MISWTRETKSFITGHGKELSRELLDARWGFLGSRACNRRANFAEHGKAAMFEALAHFWKAKRWRITKMQRGLGVGLGAMKSLIHRLRRICDALRAKLSDTQRAHEVDDELRNCVRFLRERIIGKLLTNARTRIKKICEICGSGIDLEAKRILLSVFARNGSGDRHD